jgi:hypothetical protein
LETKPLDFFGPRLKVQRAEHHIQHLDSIFQKYVRDNVRLMSRRRHEGPNVARVGTKFPKHVPTILGDAVHNLRTALDHAYCQLVTHNGSVPNTQTQFYFAKDRSSLEGTIGRQAADSLPAQRIIDLILNEIQLFEGGKLDLYGLHRLDITDKHLLLIPTMRSLKIERLDILGERGNVEYFIENLNIVVTEAEAIVAVEGRSMKLHGNPKKALEILFGDNQPYAREGVLKTLRSLLGNVEAALNLLEAEASKPTD